MVSVAALTAVGPGVDVPGSLVALSAGKVTVPTLNAAVVRTLLRKDKSGPFGLANMNPDTATYAPIQQMPNTNKIATGKILS
jgi:hypothetical protein